MIANRLDACFADITEKDGDIPYKEMKTVFQRPDGEAKSYVFCSTLDSFLSYVIDWEAPVGKLDLKPALCETNVTISWSKLTICICFSQVNRLLADEEEMVLCLKFE